MSLGAGRARFSLRPLRVILDNLKLAIKFVIGERCASRHQQAGGGGTLESMTVGGGGMKQGLLVSGI